MDLLCKRLWADWKWTLRAERIFQCHHLYKDWRARDDNSPPAAASTSWWADSMHLMAVVTEFLDTCYVEGSPSSYCPQHEDYNNVISIFVFPYHGYKDTHLFNYTQNMCTCTHSYTCRCCSFSRFSTNSLAGNSSWFRFFSKDNSLNRRKTYI